MSETINPTQLATEGKALYQRGEYLTAARAYEAASKGFASSGNSLQSAEMANNCSVAYLQGGNAQAALDAVGETAATFGAAGDLRRQGMALGNQAAALEALGNLELAAEIYQQAADVLHEAKADDLRLHVMQSLSALQLRTGRQLQALATMQAGLEEVKHLSLKQSFLKRLLRLPFSLMNK